MFARLLLTLLTAAPLQAPPGDSVAPRTWSGAGLGMLAVGTGALPVFTFGHTSVSGHFALPDVHVGLLALPFPVAFGADGHVGVVLTSRGGAVTAVLSGGPSVLSTLFGAKGLAFGGGATLGVIVASEPGRAVRFDLGRRYFRFGEEGSGGFWYFGISFLNAGGGACSRCGR